MAFELLLRDNDDPTVVLVCCECREAIRDPAEAHAWWLQPRWREPVIQLRDLRFLHQGDCTRTVEARVGERGRTLPLGGFLKARTPSPSPERAPLQEPLLALAGD